MKCDLCEKTFGSEEVLGKHMKIGHENVKLYCHFFNNERECPHGVKCIFLHEPSGQCRYGKLCERNYCMFNHTEKIMDNEENDNSEGDDIVEIWELNDSEMHEVTESKKVEDAEATFLYPSQAKEPECELDIEGGLYQCSLCDYKAKTKHELKYHEDEDHNWCWVLGM